MLDGQDKGPAYAALEVAVLRELSSYGDERRAVARLIAITVGAPEPVVKATLRQLVDQGLAEFGIGFADDGYVCGSGHTITPAGHAALSKETTK